MTAPAHSIVCPWCTHETTDTDHFRTHLMVEHRKSELAAYVLEAERAETSSEPVETSTTAAEDAEADDDPERELVAR